VGGLLFRGARVIVGEGRVIENAAFLVRDGLLMQVGTNTDVTAPADAVVMDVRGKTVMPAIVNAHSHLGWEKYTSWGSRNFTSRTRARCPCARSASIATDEPGADVCHGWPRWDGQSSVQAQAAWDHS
jgi:predicted amidohydrolase YtcJ